MLSPMLSPILLSLIILSPIIIIIEGGTHRGGKQGAPRRRQGLLRLTLPEQVQERRLPGLGHAGGGCVRHGAHRHRVSQAPA